MKYFIFILTILVSLHSYASTCPSVKICFTPGQNCTEEIVNMLNNAKNSILLQAYQFTSEPIVNGVIEAKRRGIEIQVILDKSQVKHKYSMVVVRELLSNKIPVWIDSKPAIAHNKVMVIDNHKVITGSFNFTAAAQKRNTENLLAIDDAEVAKKYTENWYKRKKQSKPAGINTEV
ncbi:phospholipase D family protein [Candidatus Mesenet endosymbiont of Phosphuga atrata]|uniref:phospholipase D family nuclease n=1 Tax=Candidatus Mesenet endosymbiont of Phosphuga atrata TaxID=3066221 RepID=UPI0030CBFA0A